MRRRWRDHSGFAPKNFTTFARLIGNIPAEIPGRARNHGAPVSKPIFEGRNTPPHTIWGGPGSLCLDVCTTDHLGPLLDFFGDESAKIGGRTCQNDAT